LDKRASGFLRLMVHRIVTSDSRGLSIYIGAMVFNMTGIGTGRTEPIHGVTSDSRGLSIYIGAMVFNMTGNRDG
jgi:hypothetical protein